MIKPLIKYLIVLPVCLLILFLGVTFFLIFDIKEVRSFYKLFINKFAILEITRKERRYDYDMSLSEWLKKPYLVFFIERVKEK